MRKSRFSEEQIIGILKEAEAGRAVKDLCRDHGVSQETVYRWRRKFGGMKISDARRLKQLEDGEPTAEEAGGGSHARQRSAQGRAGPKVVKPAARREVVGHLRAGFGYSEHRACGLIRMDRSSCRYRPRPRGDGALRQRLLELAAERPRFGYRRLHVLLRREGIEVNHKKVQRLYREKSLSILRKKRKRVAQVSREPKPGPTRINERWSMDFMQDTLVSGRCFRTLNVVDDLSREALAIEVAQSIPGPYVVRVLDRLVAERGAPDVIVVDNGPEFTSRALDAWAYENGVRLHFIQPGKPTQNCFVESFNGKFRGECLSEHWFADIPHARQIIEAWRRDYNEVRPHSALGNLPPREFAERAA